MIDTAAQLRQLLKAGLELLDRDQTPDAWKDWW